MVFNDTSTFVGHFVSSLRERRREIEEIVEEMKERDRGERKMNESEKKKRNNRRNKSIPPGQALPNCKPISVGRPSDVRYPTSLPNPTAPLNVRKYTFWHVRQTKTQSSLRICAVRSESPLSRWKNFEDHMRQASSLVQSLPSNQTGNKHFVYSLSGSQLLWQINLYLPGPTEKIRYQNPVPKT